MTGIQSIAQTHQLTQTRSRTELASLDPNAVRHHVPAATLCAPRYAAAAAAAAVAAASAAAAAAAVAASAAAAAAAAAAAVVYEQISTDRCATRALLLVSRLEPAPADCSLATETRAARRSRVGREATSLYSCVTIQLIERSAASCRHG